MKSIILVFLLFISMPAAYALDTSREEAVCLDIGFKKKTEQFANCVLELMDRNPRTGSRDTATDQDDTTCKKYGFKAGTPDYGKCRQQIDLAKNEAGQRQREFDSRQREYEAQQQAYAAQAAQDEKDRKFNAGMALLGLGSRMMQGQSPYFSQNLGAAMNGQVGSPPQIAPPLQMDISGPRTYILPGNKTMTCTTTGSITNCM